MTDAEWRDSAAEVLADEGQNISELRRRIENLEMADLTRRIERLERNQSAKPGEEDARR
jgi:DNA-binding HxlR family transcriptional regulator